MNTAEWGVYDVRSNAQGTYYTLTRRTAGQLQACVTVKASHWGTLVCLTCNTIECKHARFVERYIADHPVPSEVAS